MILILLGIKRITPRWNEVLPSYLNVGLVDTDTGGGGWYRPTHRQQDPSADPGEPNSESSSVGNDHGWSNCTMASGAMALDFHTEGALKKWGGHLRHRQGDMDGGTDLYDLRDAWDSYGETLKIRSGAGWEALKDDRQDGRFIVIQGEGNVPGSATFTGGHACCIGPETNNDGKWLWGDPLATGWQWVEPSAIRDWAERWNSSISYAITKACKPVTSEPVPEPEPPVNPPAPPLPSYADGYEAGIREGEAREADRVFRSWFGTVVPDDPPGVVWGGDVCRMPTWDRHVWAMPWPIPMGNVSVAETTSLWNEARWAGGLWV